MNMIVGKKQIVLASLVLALGIAVYLNWQYVSTGDGMDVSDMVVSGASSSQANETAGNYGDAQLVAQSSETQDTQAGMDEEAYFAEARLSRTKSRDAAVEALSQMLADSSLDTLQMAELTRQATEMARAIELEGKMEILIKAKGISDCMVYYDASKVDVIVRSDGLTEEEVTIIRDIVIRETSVPVENIAIIEV